MENTRKDIEVESAVPNRAMVVNRYAMPFAVLTVCLGVALGSPVGIAGRVSIGLLIFSALFNLLSPSILHSTTHRSAFVNLRMAVNLGCNCTIVWLLGAVWTPCWLLLALTPLATAIYGSRARTLTMACGVSAFVLFRYLMQSSLSPLDLGEQLTYCAFVVLGSLMINEVVNPVPAAAPVETAATPDGSGKTNPKRLSEPRHVWVV